MTEPGSERHGDQADARALFGLFSFLLALALILHVLWWEGFDARHPLVIAAALWLMVRPTSVPRLALLLAVDILAVAGDMPDVGDHVLLVGIAGASILALVAALAARRRALPEPGEVFERVAPFLRGAVIVVYAATALSKLNAGFLDPAVSCAGLMTSRLGPFDPAPLGTGAIGLTIWSTVLIELSLPVLLAVRRTRSLGLAVGVAFHVVLALAGNVPFAAVMLALYVAFLPADAPSRLRAAVPRIVASRPKGGSVGAVAFLALGGLWLAGVALESAAPSLTASLVDVATRLAIVSIAAIAAVLWARARRAGPIEPSAPGRTRRIHPVLAIGIALLILNAATPYLGLKSASSFNMFSNLRTEAGRWNHLIVPEGARIFTSQDDVVRVEETSEALLAGWSGDQRLVVESEVRRLLRSQAGSFATWSTPGQAPGEIVSEAAPAAISGQALLDRLGKFSPVPPEGEPSC